jgi:S-formylglutathione hydrolase FrmB
MALPLGVAISTIIWSWAFAKRWFDRTFVVALVLGSLLFGVATLNDYYHYYPTLADAFGKTPAQRIGGRADQTVVRYSTNTAAAQATSLEQSVQNIGTLPASGEVYKLSVPATASHFAARSGWLYVPPIAFSPEKVDLPVIVLLAGEPGSPNDWLNGGGAKQTLNAFAAEHHGVTPIVAMVDDLGSQFNDTECVDSSRGNAETYLTVDVPNYLKANFDVSASPSNWAIGGLSDGGMCGAMLALRHPNTFHYFLDLGGTSGPNVGSQIATIADLFHGSQENFDEHQPLYLLQHGSWKDSGLGGYFAVGSSDSTDIVSAVQSLYHQSAASGLDVAEETTQGRHTFAVWQQQFHDALPWLSYHLGATACTGQCY